MAAPQSSPLPVAPQRNEAEADFTQKANAFVSALEPFRQELQAQADFVNDEVDQFDANLTQAVADATQTATDARDTAVSAAASASQDAADAEVFRNESEAAKDAALALVNFAGKWADLTGALNTPATVFHQGAYWRLLNDLADVTASEPANDNADWLFVYSNAELRRKLLDEATLYADFVNGDYRLYEGVGAGVVRNKAFGDLFSFTRASDATGQGVSTLETVSADVARFVYSPEIKKRQGLLVEEQRTNLLLWSESPDNSAWLKDGATVSGNKLVPSGADTASHRIYQDYASGGAQALALSAALEAAEYGYAKISCYTASVSIDLYQGAVVSESGATDLQVRKGPDGKVYVNFVVAVVAGNVRTHVFAYDSPQFDSFAGDGTSGVYFWRLNLEQGSYSTSHIKTEGTQVTRAADNCSRSLGAEFNASEGTLFVIAKGRSGETLLTLGGESIASDEDRGKPYAITYESDPSAASLDFGNALFSLAAYIPRKITPAERIALTQPEAE